MPPKKRGRKPAPKSKPSAASTEPSPPSSPPPSVESPVPETLVPETPVPETPVPEIPVETETEPASETPVVDSEDALNVESTPNTAPETAEVPKKKVVKVVKKIIKKKVVKVKAQAAETSGDAVQVATEGASVSVAQSGILNSGADVAGDDAGDSVEKEDVNNIVEAAVVDSSPSVEKDPTPPVAMEIDGDKENNDVESKKEKDSDVILEKKEAEENAVVGDVVAEKKKEVVEDAVAEKKKEFEGDAVAGDVVAEKNKEVEGDAVAVDVDVAAEEKEEVLGVEGKREEEGATDVVVGDEETQISERQKRRKTEIFVGGLDRDAKEEDLRNVFSKVGEIMEVRMMMDGLTGKNKGFAFVRYKEASQAKQAVSEFSKVEICGKLCGAAALEGNDTIFLGNIDKKWKKEDLIQVLQDIGIEKIDTVTIMMDPQDGETNRGFAFLELESNRDAQVAYKKLSKKDAFGKGLNVKVAWAEPLNDPDEEEMQKVKSVYVECLPSTWDETKVRESFSKFGEIERIVLARNLPSAKRKDYAFVNYTTREAALSCIESFDMEEVKLKLSLAKPKPSGKAKQNKGMLKPNTDTAKTKSVQETKFRFGASNGSSSRGVPNYGIGNRKFTNQEDYLHGQAARQQGQAGYGRGHALPDYSHSFAGAKRSYSAFGRGEGMPYSDMRGFPRARFDNSYPVANPSYGGVPNVPPPGPSMPYYQRPPTGYGSGGPPPPYGVGRPNTFPRHGFPPYGSNMYPPRY